MPVYYDLLLDEPFDPAAARRSSRSARWRAPLTARFHGEEAAAAAEAHFDRLHVAARGCPTRSRSSRVAPDGGAVHLPAPAARRLRDLGARRRAGCWRRAASGSTASRSARTISTCPAERLDGARAPGRQAPLQAAALAASARRAARSAILPGPATEKTIFQVGLSSERPSSLRRPFHRERSRAESPPPRARRSLKTQQHVRPRALRASSRVQVRPPCALRRAMELEHTEPVESEVRRTVYAAGRAVRRSTAFLIRQWNPAGFGRRMTRKSFTESLILAQDERWRRA